MSKKVAIVMGSDSDFPVVSAAVKRLKAFEIPFEVRVMSAHRTPEAAAASLAQVDTMLGDIGSKRGEIGAVQTSLEGAIAQQSSTIMSYASSLSGIQDTDYVSAIADMKKAQFTMEAMGKVMKAVMNSQRYVLDLLK